ncbi:MAG TPA: FecR family protein [Puia sp.]|jgi:ferric-dicitrate binding protein FerR (iron transport regulator)
MDISSYSTEDFVCNESFRNYCNGSDPAAVRFWKDWIAGHPEKVEPVREAQKLISILNARQGNVLEQLGQLKDGIDRFELLKAAMAGDRESPVAPRINWKYAAAVAAALLLVTSTLYLLVPRKPATSTVLSAPAAFIHSGNEPRKTVVLPDGSVVILHSNTTLVLGENFGRASREITLSGEALFDIASNEGHPFIVHTSSINVEVLGTLFNVNAYPHSTYTETSLFRGKVAVSLKDHPDRRIILTPSQKWVVTNMPKANAPVEDKKVPLSVDPVNHKAKEIAWVRSRIKIEDEPLETIAAKLESWYGIPIVFTDSEVKGYRYSGTFESETVVKALEALQLSYPFNFRVEKDTIFVGK